MVSVTKVELTNSTGHPRRFTVAAATGIAKNKVLTLSDPRTAAEVSDTTAATGYVMAGITSMEKVASTSGDTSTAISVWTDGIFEVKASGAITVGCPIKSVGSGYFMQAVAADFASGVVCGYALETASDQEQINVRIRL